MEIEDKTKEELTAEVNTNYLEEIDPLNKGKANGCELTAAELELTFNRKKRKRAAELIIANLELKFQSEEKAKRLHSNS
jgi:hypothetical protein